MAIEELLPFPILECGLRTPKLGTLLKEGDSPTVKAAGRFTAPSAPEFIARLDPALKGQDCGERAVQRKGAKARRRKEERHPIYQSSLRLCAFAFNCPNHSKSLVI